MSPTSSTVEEAAGLIRKRIKELDAERGQLERALASLTGGREGRRGPGRPRGSSSRQRRRPRAAAAGVAVAAEPEPTRP